MLPYALVYTPKTRLKIAQTSHATIATAQFLYHYAFSILIIL